VFRERADRSLGTYSVSVLLSLSLIVSGLVPMSHFTACNAEAQDAIAVGVSASRSAVPTERDHDRAGEARRGIATRSDGAQLSGINSDGAKSAAYQAAYRTCMQRNGF
jgi:hypothetical protein